DVKEDVELLLQQVGLNGRAKWEPVQSALLDDAIGLVVDGKSIGALGRVKQRELKRADVPQAVFYVELNEEALLAACKKDRIRFNEVPRFPEVRRDLSLLLSNEVTFAQLKSAAFGAERKLLREVDLFDVYQGDKLPAGRKSYALSFTLQDTEKTLTDEQVEKAMGRIRSALEKEVGAELRG
ncbi:MAG TPA: phenylalanine--tRNA ligase subunit beta, partial [Flavobacteriales bacterium]|nr:phenylalanine--tRNA ligase subunit beta [Flavobacteriales bacterium]